MYVVVRTKGVVKEIKFFDSVTIVFRLLSRVKMLLDAARK